MTRDRAALFEEAPFGVVARKRERSFEMPARRGVVTELKLELAERRRIERIRAQANACGGEDGDNRVTGALLAQPPWRAQASAGRRARPVKANSFRGAERAFRQNVK